MHSRHRIDTPLMMSTIKSFNTVQITPQHIRCSVKNLPLHSWIETMQRRCVQFCSLLTSWTITIYKYNDLQAQWVISMEHMKEKGLVEHKVEVPAHTLILAQLYPTSRKRTLLQACEREYWNLIVQIRQSAPLFLWYNVEPIMHWPQNHMETNIMSTQCSDLCYLLVYSC